MRGYQNRVAYVVLSHGGIAGLGADELIVPYGALTLCRRAKIADREPSDCRLSASRTRSRKRGSSPPKAIRRVKELFREPRS